MNQPDPAVVEALDRFGRDIVTPARDSGLEAFDSSLAHSPQTAGEELGQFTKDIIADFNQIATLPPSMREVIRRVVLLEIDTVLHNLLLHMSDEWNESKCQITLGGIDLIEGAWNQKYWPGLHGGLYDGWYARFSKFGEMNKLNSPSKEPQEP